MRVKTGACTVGARFQSHGFVSGGEASASTSCAAQAMLESTKQRFVPIGAPLYPPELCHLPCPPAGLFLKGSDEAFAVLVRAPRMTVVGTRSATAEGLAATKLFTEALSRRGVAVISGMALGIDACAHSAALDAGGTTIAVLGCGADVVYPRSSSVAVLQDAAGGRGGE